MKIVVFIIGICCFGLSAKSQYSKDIVVEQLLKADTNTIGQKIVYPDFKDDQVTILKVTIPPGKSTGWHKHLFPVFAYVLQGTLTVDIENNQSFQVKENAAFPETLNTYHNGTNNGTTNAVLIAFYLGEKGKPLSVKKE